MPGLRFLFLLLLVLPFSISMPAAADTVELVNGDRATGEVRSISGGKLKIKTDHFGEQTLDLKDIVRLVISHPVAFRLAGEEPREGPVLAIREGAGEVTAEGIVPMDIERIERLAPTVAELKTVGEDESEGPEGKKPKKAKKWSGSVDADASLRSGNTDKLESSLKLTMERKAAAHVLTLKASAAYGEVEDELNTRRYEAEARWRIYPREQRWYLFVSGGAEHDAGRKLELRLNAAAGLGYDFWKSEARKLSADIGLDYSHERWVPFTPNERDAAKDSRRAAAMSEIEALNASGVDFTDPAGAFSAIDEAITAIRDYRDPLRSESTRTERYVNLRAGARFEQQLYGHSRLTEDLEVYPSLEDLGELRLTSELAFKTSLNKHLDLRISLKSEYDSRAEESDVEAWDNVLSAGVGYSF